tara:strand:+ start:190 stop:717 length:528 start_codon:yes stop_codon:yes gene_type:complete
LTNASKKAQSGALGFCGKGKKKRLITDLDFCLRESEIPLTLSQKVNESLLLTRTVIEFRNSYTGLIAQWERQIGCGNSRPDLHFCLTLLDDYLYLNTYLRSIEYRIDFAINAYIIHSNWQQEFIGYGYDDNLALELANRELLFTYNALNESETISEDPRARIYLDILTNVDSSVS